MKRVGDETLPFGKLTLCAVDYSEFVCSRDTFVWLKDGGMTSLDGVPVRLQLVDEMRGEGDNVIVKIWRVGASEVASSASYAWKAAA